MKSKVKLQVIPLLPTKFKADVFICRDLDDLFTIFVKRYGLPVREFWRDGQGRNQTALIDSGSKSELKGERRIVLNLSSLSPSTVIHEINHIFYYLCKCVHARCEYDAQEWHSYMLEYLFENVMDKKKYKSL